MVAAAPSGVAADPPIGRSSAAHRASVDGRLKLTEQGEVIAANYADPAIARRHLEQLTGAALIASTPEHDAAAAEALREGGPLLAELADTARSAYRALVHDDPGFAAFFRDITPIAELSDLRLGSRPAARGRAGGFADAMPPIDDLRAIPWTFAWSQSRINVPGWYGLGSALEAFRAAHGDEGLAEIGRLYRSWPFLASVLDNAEMILAKADMGVARRYASLTSSADGERRWEAIEAEYHRTVALLLRVTGRDHLLDGAPVLQRSIGLRNPYVDALSELQVRLLARFRALPPDDPERASRPAPRPDVREWRGGRPAEHRLTMDHRDHVALIRGGIGGPGGTWADIGAGEGAFTLALADVLGPGSRIIAVDRDAGALRSNATAVTARFPAWSSRPWSPISRPSSRYRRSTA